MNHWLWRLLCLGGSLLLTASVSAGLFYPRPEKLQPLPGDVAKSCPELDQEIVSLLPLTYSERPGFYQDPLNGAALWVGSLHTPAAYALLGYTASMDYLDWRRRFPVQQRIELLQRLKARRHCFEE